MADRTFHKRFTLTARLGVAVFAFLAGYFFWVKMAIIPPSSARRNLRGQR